MRLSFRRKICDQPAVADLEIVRICHVAETSHIPSTAISPNTVPSHLLQHDRPPRSVPIVAVQLTVDFLRKSRQYSDDSIETQLNDLLSPRRLFSSPSPTVLEPPRCREFIRTRLFPAWQARDDVLAYCSNFAEKPLEESLASATPAVEVSERVDPYARRKKEVWEKHDELKRVIRQENGVEAVIRLRTWELVVRRCQLEGVVGSWEKEMAQWK